jgi:hypothetical protein
MTRIKVKTKIGADGVLRLEVPVGQTDAGREVELTIEPVPSNEKPDKDYLEFLRSTAGAWQGEFERLPRGDYEIRDALP